MPVKPRILLWSGCYCPNRIPPTPRSTCWSPKPQCDCVGRDAALARKWRLNEVRRLGPLWLNWYPSKKRERPGLLERRYGDNWQVFPAVYPRRTDLDLYRKVVRRWQGGMCVQLRESAFPDYSGKNSHCPLQLRPSQEVSVLLVSKELGTQSACTS